MHRRDLLSSLAATAGGTALAGAAHARPPRSAASQSDEDAYEPLGVVDLDDVRELVVGDGGEVAYAAVDDGIATVDVSEPTEPTVLAERRGLLPDEPGGPLELLWEVWPDGDRLLAAGPAQPLPELGLHAALLFDVADPTDPTLLDVHRTGFPIHNGFFEDGVAYLTANGVAVDGGADGTVFRNELVVLDASDDQFEERSRWSLQDHDESWADVLPSLRQLHDVYVRDDIAYLPYWDAGTWLLDVSDPAAPTYLGHTAGTDREELAAFDPLLEAPYQSRMPPGNAHYVQVDEAGELMAVGREAWAINRGDCLDGGAAGIDLYDVGDPSSIEHRATIEPPESYSNTRSGPFTTSHNFDLVDGRLYSSWYFGGVKIHDVSDPADPTELAWWREPEEAAFWTARSAGRGEYVVASSADGVAGYSPGIPGRVYVFPDRAGEQQDPPSLVDAPPEFEPVPACEDGALHAGGSDGDDGSDSDGAGNQSAGDDSDDDGDDQLPGFGIGAAIAGLALAAGWRRRRSRSEAADDRSA